MPSLLQRPASAFSFIAFVELAFIDRCTRIIHGKPGLSQALQRAAMRISDTLRKHYVRSSFGTIWNWLVPAGTGWYQVSTSGYQLVPPRRADTGTPCPRHRHAVPQTSARRAPDIGTPRPRCPDIGTPWLSPWYYTMTPWHHGTMEPWYHGVTALW